MLKQLKALIVIAICSCVLQAGPYSPPAGQQGSTAIAHNDPNFVAWATGVEIERGYIDIREPNQGYANFGSDSNCLGQASVDLYAVVSLGDGGTATLTFDKPIKNGQGWDFAVFENSFSNTFLELAFVEVSSDGTNFFRFNAVSLTNTNEQVDGFGILDTTDIHNLAGKFGVSFGTPFDLEELKDIVGLDVNAITYIRIIDVVGFVEPADVYGDGIINFMDFSIFASAYLSSQGDSNWNLDCDISPNSTIDIYDLIIFFDKWLLENDFASCDINGHQINDPYPTSFRTGGFDLDAVGVRYEASSIN